MEALLLFINLFLNLNTISYCKCRPITVEENFKVSSLVLSGQILKVDTTKLYEEGLPKQSYRVGHLATLKVFQVFKGQLKVDTIFVMTGEGGGDCGYDFKLMSKSIVYARTSNYKIIDSTNENTLEFYTSNKVYFTTSNCDRTTEQAEDEEKLIKHFLARHKHQTAHNKSI